MSSRRAYQQRDLFEADDPPIELSVQQRLQLLPLVQAMLAEITSPTTSEEVGDDEGHV
jgi:hypothetical protein